MVFIGIDPSYTKTGVTVIDISFKHILFKAISPPGRNNTYNDALQRAFYISEQIRREDIITLFRAKYIVIEEPLITSQMSSRLGILSGVLGRDLSNWGFLLGSHLYSLNPNAVSNTNRQLKNYTSKTRKKVSKEVALKYLDVFNRYGYTHTIYNDKLNKDGSMKKRELSTDEAESFIMTIILMRHLDLLDKDIEKELLKINRGLNTDLTVNKIKAQEKTNDRTN